MLKGATTSTPKRAINNGRERVRESRKNPANGDRTGELRRMMTGALPLLHGSCCMYCSCGLHDTVSSANRTSLERERGRKRERERERARSATATRDLRVDSSGPTTRLLYVTVLRPIVLFGTLQNLNSRLRLFLPLKKWAGLGRFEPYHFADLETS